MLQVTSNALRQQVMNNEGRWNLNGHNDLVKIPFIIYNLCGN